MTSALLAVLVSLVAFVSAQTPTEAVVVRIAVTGESNLRSNFLESLRDAAPAEHLTIELVPRNDARLDYIIIIAQESTLGSAAAAVIALDVNGDVAASVVRSGRLSGRGALNACAKELAKKLVILRK